MSEFRPAFTRRSVLQGAAALAAQSVVGQYAVAQTTGWPMRPVRIIVPFTAGGGADAPVRTLAGYLQTTLSQTVIVENKPGADGMIAVQETLRQPADGYTVMLASATSLSYLPNMRKSVGFDPVKDFAPLTTFVRWSFYLMVHESIAGNTLTEIMAHIKANPGKYSYAAPNSGATLAAAQLVASSGADVVRAPYKGETQVSPDLISGRVHMCWVTPAVMPALMKDGKCRPVAVLLPARSRIYPDVPTIAEAGYPLVDIDPWGGLAVRSGTPKEIVTQLGNELRKILLKPDFVALGDKMGLDIRGSSSADFGQLIQTQVGVYRKAIKLAGLPTEE